MKLILLAAPFALVASSGAYGRTAELLDFLSVTTPSRDLAAEAEPRSPAGPISPVSEAMFAFADRPLGAELISPEALPTTRLVIPSWMKGRGKSSRFFAGVSAASAAFPAAAQGCTWEPYKPNPRLHASTEMRRARYYGLVAAAACEAGVPTHLFDALVTQESRYNPSARSPVGAIGIAQLMPGTAHQLGVSNPWDVVENLRGGARYLRTQLDEFKRYDLALGAYNAGPGRVRQYGRVPAFRETLGYVRTILQDVRWALGQGPQVASTARVSRPGVVRTAMLAQF